MAEKLFGYIMFTFATIIFCTPFVLFGVGFEAILKYAPVYLLLIFLGFIVLTVGVRMGFRRKKQISKILMAISIALFIITTITSILYGIN